MRSGAIPLALVLFVPIMPLAGCITADDASEAEHRLGGSFNDWNDDIDHDFRATTDRYTDDVVMLESYPPQFVAQGMGLSGCQALRDELAEKTYLASLGQCGPVTKPTNGDDPTSSP